MNTGLASDTLVYDAERIAYWQNDGLHRYDADMPAPDFDFMGLLVRWLNRWLDSLDPSGKLSVYADWIGVGLFVLLLLAVVWLFFRKRSGLLIRSSRNVRPDVTEENIHHLDFEAEQNRALSAGDYRKAICLLYLRQLKQFSDAGLVVWQPCKTPSQYLRELSDDRKCDAFRQLTRIFLQVRYGNFEATAPLYHEAVQYYQPVEPKEGGAL